MPGLVANLLPPPDFTPEQVHDLTRSILSERQFHQPAKPWLARLDDWLTRELGRLFGAFVAGGVTTVFAWLIAAMAVVLVALLLRRFSRRVQLDPGLEVETPPRRRWRASDWSAEAARHRQAGEWREAIRCSYRALVAALAERGVVEEVPGRTAREYEDLVGQSLPGADSDFGQATRLFEAVWYGSQESDAGDEERLRELGDRVLAAAARG